MGRSQPKVTQGLSAAPHLEPRPPDSLSSAPHTLVSGLQSESLEDCGKNTAGLWLHKD